ncbi:MAG: hypothetical protein IJ055_00660 [Oscillospiraceae bacterium]|nr:hypothetical protein [Oscillospiraceae bacterium]
MFSELLSALRAALMEESGVLGRVYEGFDGLPVSEKAAPACVLLPGDVRLQSPIPDSGDGVVPFEARFALVLLDAPDTPGSVLQDRLFDTAIPALQAVGAQLFSGSCPLPKADPLLGRIALRGEFVLRGLYTASQEVSA